MSIEHPEEADAAMRALEKAPALRVEFERDGKPRTLELPITED
jgi:type II secretory pathway component PulC